MSEIRTSLLDPEASRLVSIDEAVNKNFTPKEDWADWLKAGVKVVKEGGVVDTKWLREFDKQNSIV